MLDQTGQYDVELVRLNLGAGNHPIVGYTNLDGRQGDALYPLDHPDESVDEVRASHVLEHFAHREVEAVLREWCRVLKPGGTMKIAVPDFEALSREYNHGRRDWIQAFVMGGQVHERDYHKTLFDTDSLIDLMRRCGLRSIQRFDSDAADCTRYPISLNLMGVKRPPLSRDDLQSLKVAAVMSVPRLGFMDNFMTAFNTLGPLGIQIYQQTGAFWGQCLERGMTDCVDDGARWVLTVDYDTVWTRAALEDLLQLARDFPAADAIAPLQVHRHQGRPLMTMRDETGEPVTSAPLSTFRPELTRIWGAHFGLTLIRADALSELPHPWFHAQPDESGRWSQRRTDDDVSFWQRWNAQGKHLFLANHVSVGHLERFILWPDESMQTIHQHPTAFYESGPPGNVWK